MFSHKLRISLLAISIVFSMGVFSQNLKLVEYDAIKTGAQQYADYLPMLEGKTVAVVANQTSLINDKHLVDLLLEKEIKILKVFSPEHGFRGTADAGEMVDSNIDSKTGIQIISLYGNHKKPTQSDLENIDILVFDLQDVGVRFYTYISTLTYVMEACADNNIPIIILDRPNPNAYYVDGPVLKKEFKSFVGLHPVPIVYGMTIGEYALMVNGEKWLSGEKECELSVIKIQNYTRNLIVKLPVKPSPNLPNWKSIYLYPSLCFFEGTVVSAGRGTDFPFQIYGHPKIMYGSFTFTPQANFGSKHPKLEGENCFGQNLSGYAENFNNNPNEINLYWLIESYKILNQNNVEFFNNYFEKLAGTDDLRKQIENGLSAKKIKDSWKVDLKKFKTIRNKYLIYN